MTGTTNDLLRKNAEMLRTDTTEVAKESERGVIDIETLRKVNEDLIGTIEDVQRIQAGKGRKVVLRGIRRLVFLLRMDYNKSSK